MCALAELVARTGGHVSGCDLRPGSTTEALESLGVPVHAGHGTEHLEGAVALVMSAAVPFDHPEVLAARQGGIPVLKRAAAGLDPTGLVGGRVASWTGNLRMGGSDLYVVEADEYDRSFLSLKPDVAVVTNLEADHLDTYGDLAGVEAAFTSFVERVPPGGRAAVCADDHGASRLLVGLGGRG